jgi:hypothetical protein
VRADNVKVSLPSLMSNLVVEVRVVGRRRALWRLHLMRLLMAFAAFVGGVRHVDVDVSYRA